MAVHIYVLIDPFGHAKIRARRPIVTPGMTLVVIKARLAPGAIVEVPVDLADPVEVDPEVEDGSS